MIYDILKRKFLKLRFSVGLQAEDFSHFQDVGAGISI